MQMPDKELKNKLR